MASMMSHPQQRSGNEFFSNTSTEILGSASAVVLSILGLAGIAPELMACVSVIAIGSALVGRGGMIVTEYTNIMRQAGNGRLQISGFGDAFGGELLAGVAAIILGTAALLQIGPVELLPVATIVIGAGVILGSRFASHVNGIKIATSGDRKLAKRMAYAAVSSATSTQIVLGCSALILGGLGLFGINVMIVSLVASITIGIALLVNGAPIYRKMVALFDV